MIWYTENTEHLFEILETSNEGLSKHEVSNRLKRYGKNQLTIRKDPFWKVVIEPFRSVFVAVLLTAAIISLLSHEPLDATIISVIILVNSVVFYTQHYATTRVLRSLKKRAPQRVTVIRDNEEQHILSVDLVPGDIIIIREGDQVPADARIIHTDNLQVNEASLTGESGPVHKHSSTLETDKQIYEQDNMLFQGTYVLAGQARAVIIETGSRTEFGKIAELATDEQTKSPVQEKIDQIVVLLVKVVGILASIVFVLSLARGIPASEALRFVLSLTVSAVPEGLPVAVTVITVLGMRRMAKQKALVRSFKAIEDVGLITTIATDKTGTLTKNRLSIVDSWSPNDTDMLKFAGLTIDHDGDTSTDPLDMAIAESTKGKKHPIVTKLYPFDLTLRMSGMLPEHDTKVYLKGSPEHLLALSRLSDAAKHQAESVLHNLTSNGYRVIAFGTYYTAGHTPPKNLSVIQPKDVHFVGFIAFADELRPEARGAIRAAQDAGISVRLITGDHYETAYNIGKQIGLAEHPGQVILGEDLPKEQNEVAAAIRNKTVFARILPETKFRILQALKEDNITAMTGDGVNDVPALANAHIGIAMGSGSDIARDAGDIVLLNNNFATIVKAIAEGRKIFDNIRRMLFYLLATSLGEVLTMIGALLFGLPLPVTAIQILWINLVTDTAMVIPLGMEPEEDGYMKRPPRHPKAPLLGKILLSRIAIVALTMAVGTLVVVYVLHQRGYSNAALQTVAFMTLIAAQWMNAFNARGEWKSSFSRLRTANHGLVIGFLIGFGLQMLVMFGPLRSVFHIQDVPLMTLMISSSAVALAVLAASELHKWVVRKNYPLSRGDAGKH
jgi:Ca2+-transporting ATPase